MRNLIIILIAFCFFNQTILRNTEDAEKIKLYEQFEVQPEGFDMDRLLTIDSIEFIKANDEYFELARPIFEVVDAKFLSEDDKGNSGNNGNNGNGQKNQLSVNDKILEDLLAPNATSTIMGKYKVGELRQFAKDKGIDCVGNERDVVQCLIKNVSLIKASSLAVKPKRIRARNIVLAMFVFGFILFVFKKIFS